MSIITPNRKFVKRKIKRQEKIPCGSVFTCLHKEQPRGYPASFVVGLKMDRFCEPESILLVDSTGRFSPGRFSWSILLVDSPGFVDINDINLATAHENATGGIVMRLRGENAGGGWGR